MGKKSTKNSGANKVIPAVEWNRYNVVQIGARVTQETEKQLKEANRRIEESLGRRFGYNKVIDELVAFSLDEYVNIKIEQICSS